MDKLDLQIERLVLTLLRSALHQISAYQGTLIAIETLAGVEGVIDIRNDVELLLEKCNDPERLSPEDVEEFLEKVGVLASSDCVLDPWSAHPLRQEAQR